jgi:hypothetical protein
MGTLVAVLILGSLVVGSLVAVRRRATSGAANQIDAPARLLAWAIGFLAADRAEWRFSSHHDEQTPVAWSSGSWPRQQPAASLSRRTASCATLACLPVAAPGQRWPPSLPYSSAWSS